MGEQTGAFARRRCSQTTVVTTIWRILSDGNWIVSRER